MPTLTLKADIEVANRHGAGIDASRLFRDLEVLRAGGLVKETDCGWVLGEREVKAKETKQRELFA